LTKDKDLPRAERYFRKYLSQEPEGQTPSLAAAHWRLGLVLEKQGRKPEAITEMETALRLQPSFAPAKKDLQRLRYAGTGQAAAVVQASAQAVERIAKARAVSEMDPSLAIGSRSRTASRRVARADSAIDIA